MTHANAFIIKSKDVSHFCKEFPLNDLIDIIQ